MITRKSDGSVEKRFTGFIYTASMLFIGFLAANFLNITEEYGQFAMWVSGVYGAFLGGQSATDYVKTKNGN